MSIDPKNITKFNRTEAELQEFLLFCIVVAGKNSRQQAVKLDKFLSPWSHQTPFEVILSMASQKCLRGHLVLAKFGQYDRLEAAFKGVASILKPLSEVTITELENIKGIGPKTARFFVMHSRPNQRVATLDTHILRWLRGLGYNAPKQTPSGKKYLELERIFLDWADVFGQTAAELDLELWRHYSKNK
jgi:thermostable 8-oxoguanine DNA glycosylase